jgi:hypothetical protein
MMNDPMDTHKSGLGLWGNIPTAELEEIRRELLDTKLSWLAQLRLGQLESELMFRETLVKIHTISDFTL